MLRSYHEGLDNIMASIVKNFTDWLDDRTGYKGIVHESLYENIPGGSRWIYITGSMLVFAFVTQAITGLFLWMFYSASSQNAWESIYYLQNEVSGGWFLRGTHHYMAQAMVVLLPLHLLQVILCRAYQAPREINYWLGLLLMLLTLGLGLTGYLLPWDQKGYWATKVATELMSLPPGGAMIQKLVVGGGEYGHFTLTRFFAMHAGVLPAILVGVLGLHLAMFRKHGITAEPSNRRPDEYFWPQQVFKDSFGCLVLLAVVVALVVYKGGADLGPPAEPTESFGAARPEWYYLFLFQLLKKFQSEFVGAIVVPGLVMAFLFAMPIVARIKFMHVVNVVVIICLVVGASYLTWEAIHQDNYAEGREPIDVTQTSDKDAAILHNEHYFASKRFHEATEQAEREYERVKELAQFYGIPTQGAARGLQHDDPETQGPRIFQRNCASCHSYLDPEGHGISGPQQPKYYLRTEEEVEAVGPDAAPNLYGFGSREWLRGLLDPARVDSDDYFERTDRTEMIGFVHDELADLNEADQQALEKLILAVSAEAMLPYQVEADRQDAAAIAEGRTVFAEHEWVDSTCATCHQFRGLASEDEVYAPDLTGWGSAEWLRGMIANPEHESFYGNAGNDRMPAFADSSDPAANLLTYREIDMLVRWIRGDDRDLSRTSATAPELPATASDAETPLEDASDAGDSGAAAPSNPTESVESD